MAAQGVSAKRIGHYSTTKSEIRRTEEAMEKKITIKVTKTDIKLGKRENRSSCPIARATRRVTKQRHVGVDECEMTWGSQYRLWAAELPREAQKFIRAFDKGKPVKPFSFQVTGE